MNRFYRPKAQQAQQHKDSCLCSKFTFSIYMFLQILFIHFHQNNSSTECRPHSRYWELSHGSILYEYNIIGKKTNSNCVFWYYIGALYPASPIQRKHFNGEGIFSCWANYILQCIVFLVLLTRQTYSTQS